MQCSAGLSVLTRHQTALNVEGSKLLAGISHVSTCLCLSCILITFESQSIRSSQEINTWWVYLTKFKAVLKVSSESPNDLSVLRQPHDERDVTRLSSCASFCWYRDGCWKWQTSFRNRECEGDVTLCWCWYGAPSWEESSCVSMDIHVFYMCLLWGTYA